MIHSLRIVRLQGLCLVQTFRIGCRPIFRKKSFIPIKHFLIPNSSVSLCFVRTHSVVKDVSECDNEIEESLATNLFEDAETQDSDSFRDILYPNSNDPIIKLLNSCSSVQNVFDVVKKNESCINACQISQAVLVLWNLQRIFYNVSIRENNEGTAFVSSSDPNTLLENYICKVTNHSDFELLLHLVEQHIDELSIDALTCTLLYLRKMNVSMNKSVILNLMDHCLLLLKNKSVHFPLTALSRFIVAVNQHKGLWTVFILQHTLPNILECLDSCNNVEDFRLITICLIGVHRMVCDSMLELYKKLAHKLLDEKLITAEDSHVITKAVYFLNYPHWSHCNIDIIRTLMLVLQGKINQLNVDDLIKLHKVFISQLEPADLLPEIQEYSSHLLSQLDHRESSSSISFPATCELLECMVTFSTPMKKKVFEQLTRRYLKEEIYPNAMSPLFNILRNLKTSDLKLCNDFWSLTLRFLRDHESEREDYKLLRICHRYMHFNNNLGGTFRHFEFEDQMIQWLWQELDSGNCKVIPSKFSRVAAFILAYGNSRVPGDDTILTMCMTKLIEMVPQFTEFDCLNISRGLQVAVELRRHRRKLTSQFMSQIVSLNTALDGWALNRVDKDVCTLPQLNLITRAYLNRRGNRNVQLFEKLIFRYKSFNSNIRLSSRIVRDTSLNLLVTSCLIPETIDHLVGYAIEQSEHLLGDTVEKLLHLCYYLGYTPSHSDEFLAASVNVIFRDKERMQGLSLLHSALALCFFHKLPEPLVKYIFTVDFLERMDDEISQCYSKATYPMKIRHHLMQLNRAVCLDYPDIDVPWFHEKYIQEIDAHNFQVLLNTDKKPLWEKHETDKNVSKLAVVLLRDNDYCLNIPQLKGECQLKQRHLEMLGYQELSSSVHISQRLFTAAPSKLLGIPSRGTPGDHGGIKRDKVAYNLHGCTLE
uniref:FAST kinase domain-containing protein 1, mitochondrial n=1 Tax=Timema tahoe TaxID=61484 RepID=A0A7R9FLG7_9NEOP|nr:unnamed protein product [Timema tahoe]